MKTKLQIPGTVDGQLEAAPEDLEAIRKFLSFLVPNFVHTGLSILDDRVKLIRLKNLARITNEAASVSREFGISPKQLSMKVGLAFAESASVETDIKLQTMWVNLLVNIQQSTEADQSIFISTLKQISCPEAKLLNSMYEKVDPIRADQLSHFAVDKRTILSLLKEVHPNPEVLFDNLLRQQLIKQVDAQKPHLPVGISFMTPMVTSIHTVTGHSDPNAEAINAITRYLKDMDRNSSMAENNFHLTKLGYMLVKVCSTPREPRI